jgi:hypothetical protein
MASLEERLQRLEDLEEIRQLLEEYARCLDAGDHAAYAELFTEDGELHADETRSGACSTPGSRATAARGESRSTRSATPRSSSTATGPRPGCSGPT